MNIKVTQHYSDHFSAIDHDSYDGPGSPIGHGRTAEEAEADLLEQLSDWAEERQEYGIK
jgi:hypothetical protein